MAPTTATRVRRPRKAAGSSKKYADPDSDTVQELSHEVYKVSRISTIKKFKGRRIGRMVWPPKFEYLSNTVACEKLIQECENDMKRNNEVESEIEEYRDTDENSEDNWNFSCSDVPTSCVNDAQAISADNYGTTKCGAPCSRANCSSSSRITTPAKTDRQRSSMKQGKALTRAQKTIKTTTPSDAAKAVGHKRPAKVDNTKSKILKVTAISEEPEAEDVELTLETTVTSIPSEDHLSADDAVNDTKIAIAATATVQSQPSFTAEPNVIPQLSSTEMLSIIQNYQMQTNLNFGVSHFNINNTISGGLNANFAYNMISHEARLHTLSNILERGLCVGMIPSSISQGLSMSSAYTMPSQGLCMNPLSSLASYGLSMHPLSCLSSYGLSMHSLSSVPTQGVGMSPLDIISAQGSGMNPLYGSVPQVLSMNTLHGFVPQGLSMNPEAGSSSQGLDTPQLSDFQLQRLYMSPVSGLLSQGMNVQHTFQSRLAVGKTPCIPSVSTACSPSNYITIEVVNGE